MQQHLIKTRFGSLPLVTPNLVAEGDWFYVSFNTVDRSIYGCDTTALVFGQMQRFFILTGDHRD